MGGKGSTQNISPAPIYTEEGNYEPNERTRRIIMKFEKEFGVIEDRIKIKDIGTRDFSKIDLTIFNKTNNNQNFYEKCLNIIHEEYDFGDDDFDKNNEYGNMNDYFISNSTIQKPLLFLLANDTDINRKVLLDFCLKYGDELSPTFNHPNQFSILHCLAKQQTVFTKDEERLFDAVASRTYTLTRNNFKRTFIEVAIAQKSPNIEVIFERSVLANRKKLWLIIQVLKKESKVKNNQLIKILKYYGPADFVREKYMKMYFKTKTTK